MCGPECLRITKIELLPVFFLPPNSSTSFFHLATHLTSLQDVSSPDPHSFQPTPTLQPKTHSSHFRVRFPFFPRSWASSVHSSPRQSSLLHVPRTWCVYFSLLGQSHFQHLLLSFFHLSLHSFPYLGYTVLFFIFHYQFIHSFPYFHAPFNSSPYSWRN